MAEGTSKDRGGGGARIWLLALGMFAIGTDLFIVSGLLPSMAGDLGLSTAAAGQSVTVFALTYAVAAPILAGLTSAVDRKTLLVAVLIVFAAGNALSAFATSYAVLLISRAVAGAGAAIYASTASAVAAGITPPERRGRSLALVYAGMTTAIALGVPLGSAIGDFSSWRWAFGFVALLALVALAGLWPALPSVPGPGGSGVRQRLAVFRVRHAPSALLVTAFWVVGTFVVYTYLGALFDRAGHVGTGLRPWLLLLFGVGGFAGVMAGGRLADRVNPRTALATSVALLAVALAALSPALRSTASTAVALTAWGFAHWCAFPLIQHRLLHIGGRHGDMLLALNQSALYLGQTLAGALGGLLVGAGRLGSLPWAGAAFELLALLVLVVGATGAARGRRTRPARSGRLPGAGVAANARADAGSVPAASVRSASGDAGRAPAGPAD
ncbi:MULTISPECIES: MFS transporter [Streptomyces]|uniref:MFS transporter n=1 Tax=Streptomyces TaxID=1883 RepID=UPI00163C1ABE|nr:MULTISPECIES: MFS transporter [Streptomyces]MBC2874335.1 MFS transporter [Streptomyces sp. TYQ1024]UBI40368.1 MFS transporter [Streptomyces mobaraensis]UKW32950.1 MFS transporter [Streptomyces sp. TYQ1024]